MKTTNKSGGKKFIIVSAFFLMMCITGVYYYIVPNKPLNYVAIITASNAINNNANIRPSNNYQLPVAISAQSNFQDYKAKFVLLKDTTVQIYTVGEGADFVTNPFLFNSYDNDGVEVYFDMANNKDDVRDIDVGIRNFRILWKTNKIDGFFADKTGIKCVETDPSQTTYVLNITFPWRTLGYVKPEVNKSFGFDIGLIDSDDGINKAFLSWNSTTADSWRHPAGYGNMILYDHPKKNPDTSYVVAIKTDKNPFTVASNAKQLKNTPFNKFKHVTFGHVTDSLDLSGKFQAAWDYENLYIKVYARDNCKFETSALFDYGWMEDTKGKVVWKMKLDQTKHAGGALKNRLADTSIFLKKGTYWLKYHTDESHSPSQWDAAPPTSSFYGIKVSYKNYPHITSH